MSLMRLFIALMALTFFFTSDAYSQAADPRKPQAKKSPILIGPVAGYNKSMHSGGFATIANSTVPCPNFETGSDNGYYFGFSFEYLLGDPKNANSSIIARAVYDYQPASFKVSETPLPSILSGKEVSSQINHVLVNKYSLLNFEIMYRFNLPGTMLGITAGPQFGIPLGGSQEQRFELEFDPNNPVSFSDSIVVDKKDPNDLRVWDGLDTNNRTQLINNGYPVQFVDPTRTSMRLYEGDIIDPSSFRFALKFGLQYEILAGNLLFVPAVYYNYGLINISNSNGSRLNALQIGADLRFTL